jgi:hypothetical protein
MDVIVADFGIDGGVKFDACHFGAREQLSDVNIVNGVAGDYAEDCSETAYDACLLAMRDGVVLN